MSIRAPYTGFSEVNYLIPTTKDITRFLLYFLSMIQPSGPLLRSLLTTLPFQDNTSRVTILISQALVAI